MIELLPETEGNLIAVKMSGTVTEADMDMYFGRVDEIFLKERVKHLLIDWSELAGWAPGARSVGTWFGMHHRSMVGRVAVVADELWADETERIVDIFQGATVRRFTPPHRQQALAWIHED